MDLVEDRNKEHAFHLSDGSPKRSVKSQFTPMEIANFKIRLMSKRKNLLLFEIRRDQGTMLEPSENGNIQKLGGNFRAHPISQEFINLIIDGKINKSFQINNSVCTARGLAHSPRQDDQHSCQGVSLRIASTP